MGFETRIGIETNKLYTQHLMFQSILSIIFQEKVWFHITHLQLNPLPDVFNTADRLELVL